MKHKYDAVVIGSGLAGLRGALELSKEADTAVLTKLFPSRSHSGAAQGGISASLGNVEEDNWKWHMYDTVKGSDYLGDQDKIEDMCRNAPRIVYEYEHLGVPFSRTEEGKIHQRPFGGHTKDYGGEAVKRACFAADRTGHVLLHTLYEQCVKNHVRFYDEYQVFDIIVEDDVCKGVVAYELESGEVHTFRAKSVMFATGGYGRTFEVTTNAFANTGDGLGICVNNGIPLQNMEFVQFHPTGLHKLGILVTEGARGEGGHLLDDEGNRFMEDYAPSQMELAPRDLVSRAITTEISEGRGIDGKDYVHLDLRHLGEEKIKERLPDIRDFCMTYIGVDPIDDPIPIQPTAHYSMGGIPTDEDGNVIMDEDETPMHGLYAAGECACYSVHGANRLGTNSLLSATYQGRLAGDAMLDYIEEAQFQELPENPAETVKEKIERFKSDKGREEVADIREELQKTMTDKFGVFRDEEGIKEAREKVEELRERYQNISIDDKSPNFNTELTEAFELGFILDFAEVMIEGGLAREETRGAHARTDFEERDDDNWLKHTFARKTAEGIELSYQPVTITRFEPKERKY